MGFNTLTLSTLKPNPNVNCFIFVIFAILFTFFLFCFPFVPIIPLFMCYYYLLFFSLALHMQLVN
jgi:hypothetical protein